MRSSDGQNEGEIIPNFLSKYLINNKLQNRLGNCNQKVKLRPIYYNFIVSDFEKIYEKWNNINTSIG